jgi:hypothetical protein
MSKFFEVGDVLEERLPVPRDFDMTSNRFQVTKVMKGNMGVLYLTKNLQRKNATQPEYVCIKTLDDQWLGSEYAQRKFLEESENFAAHWQTRAHCGRL